MTGVSRRITARGSGTRHVRFEACFNFRDLGGYQTAGGHRVRWATLYRSDTLHRLTATDAEAFNALGLRTVIDLRSLTEIDQFGRLGVTREDLTWRSVPMLDNVRLALPDPSDPPVVPSRPDPATPGEPYVRIAEEFAPSVAAVFGILAGEDALPAVFHCTSGKDRTGILAALVLEVLGVADEVIASDYVLTAKAGPEACGGSRPTSRLSPTFWPTSRPSVELSDPNGSLASSTNCGPSTGRSRNS